MQDMVTNGTGNSRLLKTSLAAGTTWEDALAMLRAGTFPIDLAGLNNAGIAQQGSAYSKANVLPAAVCTALGLTESTAEPKDAFTALQTLASSAYSLASGRARVSKGEYTGTGTYGSNNKNSINFGFPPKFVSIIPKQRNTTYTTYMVTVEGCATASVQPGDRDAYMTLTWSGNTLSWYGTNTAKQMNENNTVYEYVGIG